MSGTTQTIILTLSIIKAPDTYDWLHEAKGEHNIDMVGAPYSSNTVCIIYINIYIGGVINDVRWSHYVAYVLGYARPAIIHG